MLTIGLVAQAQVTRKLSNVAYDCAQAKVENTEFNLKNLNSSKPEWIERRILIQELWHERNNAK